MSDWIRAIARSFLTISFQADMGFHLKFIRNVVRNFGILAKKIKSTNQKKIDTEKTCKFSLGFPFYLVTWAKNCIEGEICVPNGMYFTMYLNMNVLELSFYEMWPQHHLQLVHPFYDNYMNINQMLSFRAHNSTLSVSVVGGRYRWRCICVRVNRF